MAYVYQGLNNGDRTLTLTKRGEAAARILRLSRRAARKA